ncbi:MAG: VHL beta domain-containing protein [Bacteroidia bacterium]
MKIIFTITTNLLLTFFIYGQTPPPEYKLFIKKADSLFKLKDYKNSAYSFSSAFKTFGNKGSPIDRYNAARAWALINVADSSFDCLSRIVKARVLTDYDMVIAEKDFKNLHKDGRWRALLDTLSLPKLKTQTTGLTTITVKNKLKTTVSVYWLDYSHKEIHYFDLQPNQEQLQQTYNGHVWIIRQKKDSSQVIEFAVVKGLHKYDTNGPVRNK